MISIEKINIPNVFIIRGGSGSGKTTLAESIGKRYKSWGYFNLTTREDLNKLECILISCDAIYDGLFGHPVDLLNLELFDNSEIFFSELSEQIEVSLKKTPITLVIEGITCYKYLDKLSEIFKNRATLLSFEMANKCSYPIGLCLYPDDTSLSLNKLYPYSVMVKKLHEILIGRERDSMYENAYQYFPEFLYQKIFSSNSPEKFKSLKVPDIKDKRVLDIGCNLGYFVFQYRKMGALADGLDIGRDFIVKASKFKNIMYVFDNINFYCGDVFKFLEKKYDLISMLSTFHYFREKQISLLEKVHSLLNEGGIFILEMGLSQDNPDESYVEKYIRPGVDLEPCYFPNEKALERMIKDLFDIIYVGESVQQVGDRLPRKVFHLKKV